MKKISWFKVYLVSLLVFFFAFLVVFRLGYLDRFMNKSGGGRWVSGRPVFFMPIPVPRH